MNELLRVMQVIYSSWIISGTEDGSDASVPTGPGVLDHALLDLVNRQMFPEWVRKQLHFVESASGLSCLEAEDIQKLATEGKMTSDPNPAYVRSDIEVTEKVARHWLARLGVTENDAKRWGMALREALASAERQLEIVKA